VAIVTLLAVAAVVAARGAVPVVAADARAAGGCDCTRYAEELAAAEATFVNRGEGAAVPTTDAMHAQYVARVDETWRRATCLAACDAVPDRDRDAARVLVGRAAFRSNTANEPKATLDERFKRGLAEVEYCLELEPQHAACHMLRATIRGLQLRGSWNPLNVSAPRDLLADFRAARGGAAPGDDLWHGAATRGETLLLIRAPKIAGGNVAAGRKLIEDAARSPSFTCVVSNSNILAEARGASGDLAGARAALEPAIAAGIPACGEERYENARSIENAKRCLAKLTAAPTVNPAWDDDCA
jgi:hypothetical protein